MKFLRLSTLAPALLASTLGAYAQDTEVEKFVKSLRSVEQVKELVRDHITAECGTGSCVNNITTEICTLVGALDIRLGNSISSNEPKFFSQPDFPVSQRDLRTFKQIWSQCKPTTYQYWNYGQVLHVAYDPDPRIDVEIRRGLGILTPSQPPTATRQSQSPSKDLDKKLTYCLMPKAQYGMYSSFDGGKSAASLLQNACPTQYLAWVESCIASGDTKESCVTKAAIIAQTAIKMFNK